MTPPRLLAGLAATAAALAAATCGGCDGRPAATPSAPPRDYVFRWSGDAADLPWNRTLYLLRTVDGRPQMPVGLYFFEGEEEARISASPGERWWVHSEERPTPAVAKLLWTCRAEGAFGDEPTITVAIPPRATLELTGDEAANSGDDELAVAHEASGARLAAQRMRHRGLRWSCWDNAAAPGSEEWRFSEQLAPPSPWRFRELRPGAALVVAGRRVGRQWVARRVEFRAGETVVLDVAGQPEGGATVIAEEPRTEILLGGDLPLPPLRLTQDFYRAVWEGVPPGEHVARWPDGATSRFQAAAGQKVTLPRTPAGK